MTDQCSPAPNAAYASIGALLDELNYHGVGHICACPGSRSTPLTVCAYRHSRIRLWMHLDERAAGFFALGMARLLREPVALICSSGTAAANFFPAVIEARHSGVPLIVLTADRPPEVRDFSAPQTIDQLRIYGHYPRWFSDLALPDSSPAMLRYARSVGRRAVHEALDRPGPVHLNIPIREPLIPTGEPLFEERARPEPADGDGQQSRAPQLPVRGRRGNPAPAASSDLAARIAAASRPLIICGPQGDPELTAPLTSLAAMFNLPVLADPLSNLRRGPHDRSLIMDAYDAFLRHRPTAERLAPDLIIRIGAVPTSKTLMGFIARQTAPQILISEDGWPDPDHVATFLIRADARAACAALLTAAGSGGHAGGATGSGPAWAAAWQRVNARTRQILCHIIDTFNEPFEGSVFADLITALPPGGLIYAGNSMPVRDLDTFAANGPTALRFLANRGANGIDGVMSSALGAAAVAGGPTVLVVGDISFYHDLNGLLAARRFSLNATIVLINNDGGGIFSFLPQTGFDDWFEPLMGTPHGLDFAPAAEMFNAHFIRVDTRTAFRRAVTQSLEQTGLSIIEIRTERRRNAALHHQIWAAVTDALSEEQS